ncbi:alpha/beta fold hydrolase [Mesorhizobium sp. ZMM04-5]|uniref:Alpha/beta fold hydrolase n=1 Tax=Mesorhizobium marinum TaxID=3228790 RepID=A0ABV3R508_9HYPH
MKPTALSRFAFERDGLALAAYDSGGDGPAVVFQHGLCGDIGQVAEAFPEGTAFRLVGLECRGHGASAAGDVLSIATFADDVAALIERIGGPVVLAGISMGAAIASRIAVRRPDLVRGLVLARPAWVSEPEPANMRPNAEVGALLSHYAPEVARSRFVAGDAHAMLSREAPDNLASLLGFFERQPADVTARLLSAISADGPGVSEDDLSGLSVPTLVLATDRDFIHPLAHAERLFRLVPASRMVEMTPKGVDKAAYLSDFHTALGAFLREF